MTANERVKVLRKTLKLSGEKFGETLGVKKMPLVKLKMALTIYPLKCLKPFVVNSM